MNVITDSQETSSYMDNIKNNYQAISFLSTNSDFSNWEEEIGGHVESDDSQSHFIAADNSGGDR